ncbi:homeobox protein Hox-A10 isoform X2 [Anolis carolinensis]|uniref:homeobox protein Hox-A10 isoform X2 n=1 Tax=Anolis carolinensis TaxID=28377 RepID=UPI002F2B409A
MSARKGYLLSSPNCPAAMACSSESPAASSFLVDSLISSASGRRDGGGGGGGGEGGGGDGGGGGGGGGYYPNNSGVYLPQSSELPYGLQNYGLFPVLSKRQEQGPPPSMAPSSHQYMPGMDAWLDGPRSCRLEEPQSPQATSCAFAPSIKEESSYCLYDSDKGPKEAAATDLSTFPRLSSEVCAMNNGVPVPGYFRLSQAYGAAKSTNSTSSSSSSSSTCSSGYNSNHHHHPHQHHRQMVAESPFAPQPPGRFESPPVLPPSLSVPDQGRKEGEEPSPPSTLACVSQTGEEEGQASCSSAAEELSPAPSESNKTSPEKGALGERDPMPETPPLPRERVKAAPKGSRQPTG